MCISTYGIGGPSNNMLKFALILAVAAVSCVQAQNKYFLYTRNNPIVPEVLPGTASPNFNGNDTTIILIHGHGESAGSRFNTLIRHEILMLQEAHNVIVVDWEIYAGFSYSVASRNVPGVGHDLAYFITWIKEIGVDVSRLHLVGFGLGAHVAGIASRWLYNRTTDSVGRITGLDPSGSGWGTNSLRLRADDAQYVEVIHTDGSGLLANGIGTAIGQINFYANGGSNQPGCFSHSCSHNRAYELFAASIYRSHLEGYPCSSTTQMNLNLCRGSPLKMGGTKISKRGQTRIYRINTRRDFPF